jgi:hypothetical protein
MDKKIAIRMVGIIHVLLGLGVLSVSLMIMSSGVYVRRITSPLILIPFFYFYAGYNFINLKQNTKILSLVFSFLTLIIIALYMPDSLKILHQVQTITQHTRILMEIQGALVLLNAYIIYVLLSPQYKPYLK